MTEQHFSLIPFQDPQTPKLQITGTIARRNDQLTIHYSLSGEIETILFPKTSPHPGRKDELWKATCFEFFLAVPDEAQYWEVNLSPSGDWNVYRMESYRRIGFREETLIPQLPFSFRKEPGCISVSVMMELIPILRTEQPIQVGIASIIHTKDDHETYWALLHPEPDADFHLRESFIVEI